jgi:hypothetical protein
LIVAALEEEEKGMAQTKLTWSNLGPIRINMTLDHTPKQPGVYRLIFKLWGNTYIGEAGARGLRARIAAPAGRNYSAARLLRVASLSFSMSAGDGCGRSIVSNKKPNVVRGGAMSVLGH